MKWGTLYGADYVNKLYYSVRRNVTGDLRFVCFTDDVTGIVPQVETMPLPKIDLPYPDSITGWQKISVWQDPLYDIMGDVLFLDIDIVITDNIDALFDYMPDEFVVIDNWTQPNQNIGNTSVFKFPVGKFSHVYDDLMRDTQKYLKEFRIEQQYVSAKIPSQKFWPADWIISFKHSCMPKFPFNLFHAPALPDGAKIVAFHGKPDPIDALQGVWPCPWYKKFYKQVKKTAWIGQHWREGL
jgi:hypothetical protein